MYRGKLLTTSNPKTMRGAEHGYAVAVLHLAPGRLAGKGNVCPWATSGCLSACLNTAGRGGLAKATDERVNVAGVGEVALNSIQRARIERTRRFYADRNQFLADLARDIAGFVAWCKRHGVRPAVRLNGTSDLPWERLAPWLFSRFEGVVFYDYTKSAQRMREMLVYPKVREMTTKLQWPRNYRLTFSRSETNGGDAAAVLALGGNVAAVYAADLHRAIVGTLPGIINGDAHDLRFLDPAAAPGELGYTVGLVAKGRAKHDETGFVIR